MRKKTIINSILTIISISFFTKIIGFLRETVLANFFGTSITIDIYYLSYGIFFALASIIGTSIGLGYIPKHEYNKRKYKCNWKQKSFETFNFTLVISLFITLLLYFNANYIAKVLGSNYNQFQLNTLISYIKINSIAFLFQSLSFFLICVLNGEKRFGIGEVVGVFYSLTIIFVLFFFKNGNEIGFIKYSFLISSIITFITLYLLLYKVNFFFTKINFYKNSIVSISTLIGSSIIYIGQIYDRSVAADLSEGSLSALNYSGNIHSLINVFFIISISNVIFSEFSSIDKEKPDYKIIFNELINKSITLFIVILLPLSLFLYLNKNNIVSFIFERGEFNYDSVIITSSVFGMYVIGTFFFAIRDLSNKLLYALNDRKTPIISGVIFLLVNIVLCFIMSQYLEVRGISLAITLTSIFASVYIIFVLKKKHDIKLTLETYKNLMKVLIFCLFFYIVSNLFDIKINNINKLSLFLSILIYFLVFVLFFIFYGYFTKIKIIEVILNKIIKR